MLSYYTLYPAALAFIFAALSVVISGYQYRRLRFIELRNITIGWILLSQFPLMYIVFHVLRREELTDLRRIVGPSSLTVLLVGHLIVWYNLFRLSNQQINIKHQGMVFFSFFSIGVMVMTYRLQWEKDRWINTWEPEWGLLLPLITMTWINLEIILLLFRNYTVEDIVKRKSNLIMLIGWILYSIAPGLVYIERVIFNSGDTVIYFYITGISLFMVSIGLYFRPLEVNVSPTAYLHRTLHMISNEYQTNTYEKLEHIINNLLNYHHNREDINGYLETLLFKAKFELSQLNLKDLYATLNEIYNSVNSNSINNNDSEYLLREVNTIEQRVQSVSQYLQENNEIGVEHILGFDIINSNPAQNIDVNHQILKKLKLGDLLILIKLLKLYPIPVNIKEAIKGFDHSSISSLYYRIEFLSSTGLILIDNSINPNQKSRFITISESGISLIKSVFKHILIKPYIDFST